jgi:hypothetical protein
LLLGTNTPLFVERLLLFEGGLRQRQYELRLLIKETDVSLQ